MRTRLAVVCLLIAASAAAPATARAGAWILAPGEQFSQIHASRLSSDDFYDAAGFRTTLARGGLFEQRDAVWTTELGWKKSTSFFLTLPYSSATRRLSDTFGGQSTETGFGDLQLGFRRKVAGGATRVISLEATWKAPLGYARKFPLSASEIAAADTTSIRYASPGDSVNFVRNAGRPSLGDGEQAVQGILWYGGAVPGSRGFLELGGGYRYYFQHFADQVLVRGNLGLWFGPSLLIAGRYEGEFAIGEGDTPAHEVFRHLVGPEFLYRVDESIDVFLGSMHSATGQNALHTDQIYAGLAFRNTKLNRLQGFLGGKKHP